MREWLNLPSPRLWHMNEFEMEYAFAKAMAYEGSCICLRQGYGIRGKLNMPSLRLWHTREVEYAFAKAMAYERS